jgi:diguanylate cyclase (GGDEF)-like protein/PAS domain S-box-containing protein
VPSSFKGLIDGLTEGIYFLDRGRLITYWNPGAERLTGYSSSEVLGRSCADRLLAHMDTEGRILCTDGCPMEATMRDGRERAAELFLHHRNGHRVPITVRAIPIRGPGGEIVGAVEVFNDVSGHLRAAERIQTLESLSLIDPLTGAGNRSYLEIQIALRLAEKKRDGLSFGLISMDVGGLVAIGQRHGCATGDKAFAAVGRSLANGIRAVDFLGRWGDEQFVVVIGGLDGHRLSETGRRLGALATRSTVPDVTGLELTVSVGVTEARCDDTVATLVERGNAHVFAAKNGAAGRVVDDASHAS